MDTTHPIPLVSVPESELVERSRQDTHTTTDNRPWQDPSIRRRQEILLQGIQPGEAAGRPM